MASSKPSVILVAEHTAQAFAPYDLDRFVRWVGRKRSAEDVTGMDVTSAPVVRQAAIVASIARTEPGVADQADARVRHTAIMLTRCTSANVSSNNKRGPTASAAVAPTDRLALALD
jgi:hypothetical protein